MAHWLTVVFLATGLVSPVVCDLFDQCDGRTADYEPVDNHTRKCYESSYGDAVCAGRCGTVAVKGRFMWSRDKTCSCDELCVHYHDCCPDYWSKCGQLQVNETIPKTPGTSCILAKRQKDKANTLVVSDCPRDFPDKDVVENCLNTNGSLFTRVPIRDNVTNIQYRNRFCALCNNASNLVFWRFDLSCEANATDKVKGTLDEFISRLDDPNCNFTFYDPGEKYRFCVLGTLTTCPKSCKNQALVDKCHQSQTIFTYRGSPVTFKNGYCALCNGYYDISINDLTCKGRKFPADGPGLLPGENELWKFSFSLLLDVNSAGGVSVGLQSSVNPDGDSSAAECTPDNLHQCVYKSCQRGYELKGNKCVPKYVLSEVKVEINYIPIDATFTFSDIYFRNYIQKRLYKEKGGFSDVFEIHLQPDVARSKYNISLGNDIVVLGVRLLATFLQRLPASCVVGEEEARLRASQDKLKSSIKSLFIKTTMGYVQSVKMYANLNDTCYQTNSSAQTDSCYVTERYNGTFEVLSNDSIWLNDTNVLLDPGEYILLNDTVLICGDETKEPRLIPEVTISNALGITTIVCLVLSAFCLFIRLVLQFSVPIYRSFPAKIQFCFVLTLFIAGLVYLFRPFAGDIYGLCYAFGVVAHFAYLSVFVWMNLIAIDTWNTFNPKRMGKNKKGTKQLVVFCVVGWFLPAVIVGVTILLDFLSIDMQFQPQYSRNGVCWITQRYALLIMFAAPLAVIVLTNIIIFILTAVTLHRAMKFSKGSSTSKTTEKDEFFMYLKLFILLGVTWVVGLLAMVVNHDALWYVFIILNAGQGVFILITTVFTKRVRSSMRRRDSSATTLTTTRSETSAPAKKWATVSDTVQAFHSNNGNKHGETATPGEENGTENKAFVNDAASNNHGDTRM